MTKRILIVEDTEDNRQIIRDLMTSAGYELIEAVDGGRHGEKVLATFGPFPADLPDAAVH